MLTSAIHAHIMPEQCAAGEHQGRTGHSRESARSPATSAGPKSFPTHSSFPHFPWQPGHIPGAGEGGDPLQLQETHLSLVWEREQWGMLLKAAAGHTGQRWLCWK